MLADNISADYTPHALTVIERDTNRLREVMLLANFASKYRALFLGNGASGDLGVLAEVEARILKLAEAVIG